MNAPFVCNQCCWKRFAPNPSVLCHPKSPPVHTWSLTSLVENIEDPPSGENFVEGPRTKLQRNKSLSGPTDSDEMSSNPSVLPYHCLMKDQDIQPPASSFVGSPITKNYHFSRSPEPKQRSKIIAVTATTPMSLTCPDSHSSLNPTSEFYVQNDEFLFGTPTQSNANVHQASTICLRPRSSTPLKFVHHDGSPFATFRPIVATTNGKHTTPPRTHEGLISCDSIAKHSPSPCRMPVNLVLQTTGRGSKRHDPSTLGPYDLSARGNSIKSSPVLKSFDSVAGDQGGLEDPEVKHYFFKNPIMFNPPTPGFELSTKRRTDHQKAHPPLPSIKLTPRTRKREFGQGHATAVLVGLQLVGRLEERENIDTSPSRIKLVPKNERKVSVEQTHSKETTLLDPDDTPIRFLSLPTPNVPMELQFNNDDNMDETARAQTMRHFPDTLACYQKKSRSLFDRDSSFDPIQRLILADAMVEASRKNDPLTDDEDSDVECNPDYVLCCPPSTGKRGENAVLSSGTTNMSNCCADVLSAVSTGNRFGSSHFLPAAGLQQEKSLSSVHRILGNNYLLEEEPCTTTTLHPKPVSADIDFLKATRYNASISSLAMSSDSSAIDINRDMFTPSPILEEGNDFRTLSPPLLRPNVERVQAK